MQHMLTRSLGSDLFVAVDVSEQQVLPGDVLVLCSDGLHGALPQAEIELLIAGNHDLEVAAKALVEAANERDGSDNVSIQLIRVGSIERIGMYRGPYQLP
jgi:serine/threonine protein phosphatase PrpC